MYDASFDQTPNRLLWAARIAAVIGIFAAATADAQMPGAPVLQNAWATPGIVAAANFGGGSDGSVIAGAVGWTPASGRFQVSGGIGSRSLTGYGSGFAYGARVALPIFGGGTSAIGIAAFAGVGGAQAPKKTMTPGQPALVPDSSVSTTQVPLGAAVGWRHMLGATRGISVYATPAYTLYSGGSSNGGVFRAAVGADIGITTAIGATVGVDFGGSRGRGVGGPSGTQYAAGVSYAFGRR